jgi:hypothetical protein
MGMKILCFDPSGNISTGEGKGTSGWSVFKDKELIEFGEIKASDFDSKEAYFQAHEDLILQHYPDIIVCESYRLFGNKAKQQSGSLLETPMLIGYMQMVAYKFRIQWVTQDPSTKARVADDILTRMGVFEKKGNKYYCQGKQTNIHMRDAIRHGIFYIRYKLKEEVK